MTESLQNKKKITKLPKKEAGGDEKHAYFFTRPNLQTQTFFMFKQLLYFM